VLTVALVRHIDPTRQRQNTHLAAGAERVIPPVHVAESRRHIVWSLVQPAKGLLGIPLPPCLSVLVSFGPQPLVGGPYLPEDTAGHLGRQALVAANIGIQGAL
jgi:hypothetical protein